MQKHSYDQLFPASRLSPNLMKSGVIINVVSCLRNARFYTAARPKSNPKLLANSQIQRGDSTRMLSPYLKVVIAIVQIPNPSNKTALMYNLSVQLRKRVLAEGDRFVVLT